MVTKVFINTIQKNKVKFYYSFKTYLEIEYVPSLYTLDN